MVEEGTGKGMLVPAGPRHRVPGACFESRERLHHATHAGVLDSTYFVHQRSETTKPLSQGSAPCCPRALLIKWSWSEPEYGLQRIPGS